MDNIAANRALRAAWQQRVDATRAQNVARLREARLEIQTGAPYKAAVQ